MNITKERISSFEERLIKTNNYNKQDNYFKNKWRPRDLLNDIKWSNINIMGINEEV